jgi:hypothetical protein
MKLIQMMKASEKYVRRTGAFFVKLSSAIESMMGLAMAKLR